MNASQYLRLGPIINLDVYFIQIDWLIDLGLTALWDSFSVYIGPSPRDREKEKRSDRLEEKCPNNPHPHLLQAQ